MTSFGFTNDAADYEAACKWREDAIADGWEHEPTYPGHEPESTACKLHKGAFRTQIITRERVGKWAYEADVHVWGSDGLAVKPDRVYSFQQLADGLRVCVWCGATDVSTSRVGFANRVCEACLPEARKKLECPGWYD